MGNNKHTHTSPPIQKTNKQTKNTGGETHLHTTVSEVVTDESPTQKRLKWSKLGLRRQRERSLVGLERSPSDAI